MTLNSVVLPAPFGPMSPVTLPGSAARLTVVERDVAAEADGDVTDLKRRHGAPPRSSADLAVELRRRSSSVHGRSMPAPLERRRPRLARARRRPPRPPSARPGRPRRRRRRGHDAISRIDERPVVDDVGQPQHVARRPARRPCPTSTRRSPRSSGREALADVVHRAVRVAAEADAGQRRGEHDADLRERRAERRE